MSDEFRPLSLRSMRQLRTWARAQESGSPVVVSSPSAPTLSVIEAMVKRGWVTTEVKDGAMSLGGGARFRWNYTITVTEAGLAEVRRMNQVDADAARRFTDALNASVPGILRQLGNGRAGR